MKLIHTLCATALLGAFSVSAVAQTSAPETPPNTTAPTEAPITPDKSACTEGVLDCKSVPKSTAMGEDSRKAEAAPCAASKEGCAEELPIKANAPTMPAQAPVMEAPTVPEEATCISGDGVQVPCPDFSDEAPKADMPE